MNNVWQSFKQWWIASIHEPEAVSFKDRSTGKCLSGELPFYIDYQPGDVLMDCPNKQYVVSDDLKSAHWVEKKNNTKKPE